MNPLVSVLVPIYNASPFLAECLNSIVIQTFENLQIVLFDDGSTDNSLSICEQFAVKDERIEIFHQENAGVATTRNNLLSKIRGDFFLFVDADDWIENNMIEILLSIHSFTQADIMCSDISSSDVNVEGKKEELRAVLWNKETVIRNFLYHKEFRGSLWNKLFATRLLGLEHFVPEISYGEDALFCWNILKQVDKVAVSSCKLYHYRMNDSSISHATFSDKKFSAHIVWNHICKETAILFPQFSPIAEARHCIEDTLLMRDAAHCRYRDQVQIKLLQSTIRHKWRYLLCVDITSFKMKIFSLFASFSYKFAAFF